MNEIEATFAKPFYLKMMGQNALRTADERWTDLVAAGRAATVSDVSYLLRTNHWRPVVMGAWFSLVVPPDAIADDLVAAMAQSKGSLTAPPLATVATIVVGAAALPAMTAYIEFITTPSARDASWEFVAAAVEYLGAEPAVAPTGRGRQTFRDLHDLALRLRAACAGTT